MSAQIQQCGSQIVLTSVVVVDVATVVVDGSAPGSTSVPGGSRLTWATDSGARHGVPAEPSEVGAGVGEGVGWPGVVHDRAAVHVVGVTGVSGAAGAVGVVAVEGLTLGGAEVAAVVEAVAVVCGAGAATEEPIAVYSARALAASRCTRG